MKYKVGDKVKVIENNIFVKTGAIGKIIKTRAGGYFILFNEKDIKSGYKKIAENIYLLESRIRKYKVKTKPKVYYWDRSATKEQINQLVFEQRFNDMCEKLKESVYDNSRTKRNKKTSKKNNACNRATR